MKFKEVQLIINDKKPTKEDMIKIKENGLKFVKEYHQNWYEVDSCFIEGRFLWIYFEYDNSQLYNENIYNGEKDKKESNPRTKSQVELRKQFFICYDTSNELLYTTDLDKRNFIEYYMYITLQKDVKIKNIYASLEDFEKKVKTISSLRFTQIDNIINELPGSLFRQNANLFGFDLPKKMITKIEFHNEPIKKLKSKLNKFVSYKNDIKVQDIILIGHDDKGVEQSFDFNSIIKNIELKVNKNNDSRYDPIEIQKAFLDRIR